MNRVTMCNILAFSPIVLGLLNGYEIIPEQYESLMILGLIIIAIASCVALRYFYSEAIGIGSVAAALFIITSLVECYAYIDKGHGTFEDMTRSFFSFICGVWYFALLFDRSKK